MKGEPKDGLYVEIEYTPRGSYNWVATLRDDDADGRNWITSTASDFEWLIKWYARKMLAAERKKRRRDQRAKDLGKKVIR